MPQNRVVQVLDAIDELAAMDDPSEHHNVNLMQGKWADRYRLRVGEYRVIFKLLDQDDEPPTLLIYVSHIGTRGDIYG